MQTIIRRSFALVKKSKMEINIRTPYKTIVENFSGFSRLHTKTNEAALSVQNRMPASVHLLVPGTLKVKLDTEVKGFSGELVHMGGFLVIHPDNTCDINLVEAFDKKELMADKVGKVELGKDKDGVTQKYVDRIRSSAQKVFVKA